MTFEPCCHRLASSSWMDKALRPSERLRPPNPNHMMKNRFPKLTPGHTMHIIMRLHSTLFIRSLMLCSYNAVNCS